MSEIIERTLAKYDFEFKGNGRHVKVIRSIYGWVLNFCDGTIANRDYKMVAERVAKKYIDTGIIPKYRKW